MQGTGFAQLSDTRRAVDAALDAALADSLGDPPGLALVFVGGRHDPRIAWERLSHALSPVPIIGGAAVGCIGAGRLGYSGFEVSVALFPARCGPFLTLTSPDLRDGEFAAGRALGARIAALGRKTPTVLLFFDSVIDAGPPPRLHPCSHLVDGVYAGLEGHPIELSGAGTLADFTLSNSWLFAGGSLVRHAAVAVICPPALSAETAIFHGCIPISGHFTITRIEGSLLYELDGQPAEAVIRGFLPDGVPSRETKLMLHITIGQDCSPGNAEFEEHNYVNRLILGLDEESGAVRLFDADFAEGQVVQLMLRDPFYVLETTRTGCVRVAERLSRGRPFGALYFDCAGRAGGISGTPEEEAEIVLRVLGPHVPLSGFYSAVEIAPILGRSRPLDWTGVLTVIYEKRPAADAGPE
ncbi:MAG: hypothetical protein GVY13_14135 [Alphaproteobacteria bacterium]|nr:hypothetical protein [Alphaproteobacteria bacterium]